MSDNTQSAQLSQEKSVENRSYSYIKRADHSKDHPYSQISNYTLRDKDLQGHAGSLLFYLLSHKNEWKVRLSVLAKDRGISLNSVKKYIHQLITLGYVKRNFLKKEKGYFDGYEYEVSEWPLHNPLKMKEVEEFFKKFLPGTKKRTLDKNPQSEKRFAENLPPKNKQEEERNNTKELTNPPTSQKTISEIAKEKLASSIYMDLFERKQAMWEGVSDDEFESIKKHYYKCSNKYKIPKPVGWLYTCLQQGWHKESSSTQEDVEKNREFAHELAKKYEGSSFTYFCANGDKGALVTGGVDAGVFTYHQSHESFIENIKMAYKDKRVSISPLESLLSCI